MRWSFPSNLIPELIQTTREVARILAKIDCFGLASFNKPPPGCLLKLADMFKTWQINQIWPSYSDWNMYSYCIIQLNLTGPSLSTLCQHRQTPAWMEVAWFCHHLKIAIYKKWIHWISQFSLKTILKNSHISKTTYL